MEVCGVEITEADLRWLEERGRAADAPSRSKLARAFCDRIGLVDARGNPREVSGRVILGRLNRCRKIILPEPKARIPRSKPPSKLPLEWLYRGDAKTVRSLFGVELVPVTSRDRVEHRQWEGLLQAHH